MNRLWTLFRSYPYISNVVGYTTLFASADLIQQSVLVSVKSIPNHSIDLAQTARVALVGFFFHSNFNYHWLRALERMFPGGGAKRISLKVLLDQLIAAPATISAFYIGLSTLEGKEDPFADWKNKFWASYKAVNFSLVPPVARTVFAGGIALGWTIFLCHFRQQKTESHTHT
uniref:Si:ch211-120k19.1 n=1 Tax=Astyanax mexicanus TaxID=7994 RepID=A0A3B1IQ76_ASTMX